MNMMDIAYENDVQLRIWLDEFDTTPLNTIPGIPYSYNEIVRELIKRSNCKAVLEDINAQEVE